jgi:hypothetical protein
MRVGADKISEIAPLLDLWKDRFFRYFAEIWKCPLFDSNAQMIKINVVCYAGITNHKV